MKKIVKRTLFAIAFFMLGVLFSIYAERYNAATIYSYVPTTDTIVKDFRPVRFDKTKAKWAALFSEDENPMCDKIVANREMTLEEFAKKVATVSMYAVLIKEQEPYDF